MHNTSPSTAQLFNGWRLAGWGSLIALLLLPALAMQLTNEVNWTASDFVFAALLLGFVGTVFELAVRFARPGAARSGYILAGVTAFLTFWSNAAVGIIGDEATVNVFFFLLVIAGFVAASFARFRPAALCWIAVALALGQFLIGVAALSVMPVQKVEWGVLTFFALLWLIVAACFKRAANSAGQ